MLLITEQMDALLQPSNVEGILFSAMNPKLGMLGMFEKQNLKGKKHFAFYTDRTTAEEEILKGILHEPAEIEEASQLPQIQVTGINKESGNTVELGFEMQFTEEAVNDDSNIKYVERTIAHAGYSMQRTLNRYAYQVLMDSADAPTISLHDGAWTTSEHIDEDVKELQRKFHAQEGYDYTLTDMYVSNEALWGAEDYYDAIRVNGFDPNNVRNSTLNGINELESGLIGLDKNISPAMWYYNVHPNHNTWNDEFGSIINVNRYDQVDEKPFYTKIQMWVEFGFAVTEPRAVLYQEGI